MKQVFSLAKPGSKAILLLILLGIVVPVGSLFTALSVSKSSVNPAVIGVILLLAILPSALIVWVSFARRTVEFDDHELVVKTAFYTAKINRDSITPEIAILDTAHFPGGGIATRTNGIGLPGYQVGWFSLKNGRTVFLTYTGGNALFIPTNTTFDLLLDANHANALLEKLKSSSKGRGERD